MNSQLRRSITLLAGAAMIAGALGAPAAVVAATPANGSINTTTTKSVTWQGKVYVAEARATVSCPKTAAQDPSNAECDHFTLAVNVPAATLATHDVIVEVTINWASETDDFDLQVFNKNNVKVGESTSFFTTSERAEFMIPATSVSPYEVRVSPSTAVAAGYTGTAALTLKKKTGGVAQPVPTTGGIAFAPSVVVDAQRTEGEPLSFITKEGHYWESGPFGTATQQSFIHRSIDGGDQFNIVSPVELRPNLPPGGGDTDIIVDDQNVSYFSDLEGLVQIDASVSNDRGNTWRKNPAAPAATGSTIVDRQWQAVDNGPTGAASDNTVFLTYRQTPLGSYVISSPGSTGPLDPIGGLVYTNATDIANPAEAIINTGAPCGEMRFDHVKRNLYLSCSDGNSTQVSYGHVNPGQRTGIHFETSNTPPSPGGGDTGELFPILTTDKAGNVYVAWVDTVDHQVYYTYSKDGAKTWGPVRQVNGKPSNSNIFPWAIGGSNGTLVVAWLGNTSKIGPNEQPSWFNDRKAATAYPWHGYVSVIRNATSATPTFNQARFTHKPMHYGQVCNAGTLCLATGGDRTMADYFGMNLDAKGAIRIVYNDTTSQHHGAHLYEARQTAGPSGIGTTLADEPLRNPMKDRFNDAQWPHYSPTGRGPNKGAFDFGTQTQVGYGPGVRLTRLNQATLRVQMYLKDNLSTATPPTGKTRSLWLTRFQARSIGDGGEESYRIFYVGAEATGPGAPTTFFAGSGDSAQGAVVGDGCTTTTIETCKIVNYPNEVAVTGNVNGKTITIDVPIQGGFGGTPATRPILSSILYNVTAFSFGRNAPNDLYADVDATRAYDFSLLTNRAVGAPADPVVGLVKSGPTKAQAGADVRYTLKYKNLGPAASENGRIVDWLPRGTYFVSASSGGTYDAATRRVIWNLGTVPGSRDQRGAVRAAPHDQQLRAPLAHGGRGSSVPSTGDQQPLHVRASAADPHHRPGAGCRRGPRPGTCLERALCGRDRAGAR